LLTFSLEAIGKEGEVYVLVALFLRACFYSLELILEDALGIIKEAPDEGGFSVVNGTGSGESK